MAKVKGPLFSMGVTGSFGDIVFDRRGFAYLKPDKSDPPTPGQDNYRLVITVVQKCVSACSSATRQQLKELTNDPSPWNSYLVRQVIGPQWMLFLNALAQYTDATVDQAGWEAAAASIGLREVFIPYVQHGPVTPGAQLFLLASTLFSLGLYTGLGEPNGNAEVWKDSITS